MEVLGNEIKNDRIQRDGVWIDRAWLDNDWHGMKQGVDGYPKNDDLGYFISGSINDWSYKS